MRSTEINAVIGRSQLKRLDQNNRSRTENLRLFLENLDPEKYRTDFVVEGSCNYAFTLVLKSPDPILCENVMRTLRQHGVEFRRGTSGGGNQLRQPYLKKILGEKEFEQVSSGRPCSFLWILYRQLSRFGTGKDFAALCHA